MGRQRFSGSEGGETDPERIRGRGMSWRKAVAL